MAKKKLSEPRKFKWPQYLLGFGAFIFAGATLFLALIDKASAASVTAAMSAGMMAFIYLPIFESVDAFGFHAKIRNEIDRAEQLLHQIRSNAEVSAKILLEQMAWSGRWGSVKLGRRHDLISALTENLSEMGITPEAIDELLEPVLAFIGLDLHHRWRRIVDQRVRHFRTTKQAELDQKFPDPIDSSDPVRNRLVIEREAWGKGLEDVQLQSPQHYKKHFKTVLTNDLEQYPFPDNERQILAGFANELTKAAEESWDMRNFGPLAMYWLEIDDAGSKAKYREFFGTAE